MPKLTINGRTLEAKAILFDKDGTLVDFHALWINVVSAWIARLPEPLRLDAAEQREIASWLGVTDHVDPIGPLLGRRDDQIALIAGFLYQRRRLPFSTGLDHARNAFQEAWKVGHEGRFLHLPAGCLKRLPKVYEALVALRARGWQTGMVTSDDRSMTAGVLAALDLTSLLDGVACGDDVKRGKPHPDLVHALCAKLGVSVSETVLVGDGHNDLKMGRSAGCLATIGVTSGCDSRELLLAAEPDLVLDSVADLLTMMASPTIRLADLRRELDGINAFYAAVGYGSHALLDDRVIVAELDGRLLGCVRLCEEEGHMVLRGMHVPEAHQGQGIGKAMLMELLRQLDGRPCYCLPYERLETRLYGRHGGFRRVESANLPPHLRDRLALYHREGKDPMIAMIRPGS